MLLANSVHRVVTIAGQTRVTRKELLEQPSNTTHLEVPLMLRALFWKECKFPILSGRIFFK